MSDPVELRMAAGAALIVGLAHELRNALAAADTSLWLVQRAGADDARRAAADAARAHVRVAQDLVSRALDATRGEPVATEPIGVHALLEGATSTARTDPAVEVGLAVEPADLVLRGDPLLLARAVENLVDNARDVARAAGRARVRVWVDGRATAEGVAIRVEDDGPGIDPAVAGHLFEALRTARPGGTGLGLRFVRAVAELHGGRVEAADRAGGGAAFTILIPR